MHLVSIRTTRIAAKISKTGNKISALQDTTPEYTLMLKNPDCVFSYLHFRGHWGLQSRRNLLTLNSAAMLNDVCRAIENTILVKLWHNDLMSRAVELLRIWDTCWHQQSFSLEVMYLELYTHIGFQIQEVHRALLLEPMRTPWYFVLSWFCCCQQAWFNNWQGLKPLGKKSYRSKTSSNVSIHIYIGSTLIWSFLLKRQGYIMHETYLFESMSLWWKFSFEGSQYQNLPTIKCLNAEYFIEIAQMWGTCWQ